LSLSTLNQYLLSLPERVLRSASALSAGIAREIGDVVLPKRLRQTRVYQTMVEATLRFLIEQVGEVEGAYPGEEKLANDFLLKRAVGDGIDLAGIAALHASPVWVLAALADVSGAGRQLIEEITGALKQEALLDPQAKFETVDQVLDGLEQAAGKIAWTLRFPPLDIAALRNEWSAIKQAVASIPPRQLPSPERLRGEWEELKTGAAKERRSVFEMSSLIALSTVRNLPENVVWLSKVAKSATIHTGRFFAEGLLDHYSATLKEIRGAGFGAYWVGEFRPYLRAAAAQFSPARESLTQRLLRRKSKSRTST
jgi:hypothetical protein